MLLGIETFSYHLSFAYGRMNIFDFIEKTADLGLDGVQINAEGDDLGHLGSDDNGFLREVSSAVRERDLFIELDTCGTEPDYILKMLNICKRLNARIMRTYSSFGGDVNKELAQAAQNLSEVVSTCVDYGIKISLENHEFESSHDVLKVIRKINSQHVGAHIDTGNSMMVWEDPLKAIENMAPYAVSTHFKDHMIILVDNQPMIVGVPLGKGSLDLVECYRLLSENSPLQRINIEVCYGYMAPFRLTHEKGFGGKLNEGCFRIVKPPYDSSVVAPHLMQYLESGHQLKSYAWQDLAKGARSKAQRDRLMDYQDQAVIESVEYVKSLKNKINEK